MIYQESQGFETQGSEADSESESESETENLTVRI